MNKIQILNDIKKYGILTSVIAVFGFIIEPTMFIGKVFTNGIMIISILFWVLFIKNISKFYENKSLNTFNIITSIGLIFSTATMTIIDKYVPQGGNEAMQHFFEKELGLAVLVFVFSIVLIISCILLLIVSYKLAKITKSKIFLYCFYLDIFSILLYVGIPLFDYKIDMKILSLAMIGLFLYGIVEFYNKNIKLHNIATGEELI